MLLAAAAPAQVRAATPPDPAGQMAAYLDVAMQAGGIRLTWPAQALAPAGITPALLDQLPEVRYAGYSLPMQLQMVLLTDAAPASVKIATLESQRWLSPLPRAASLVPPVIGWDAAAPVLHEEAGQLPGAPVFILREGRVRGQRVAVVAFSPLYSDGDLTRLATQVDAFVPSAQLLTSPLLPAAGAANVGGAGPAPSDPTNAAALRPAIKVQVSQAGMQQISGETLQQAGLAAGVNLEHLHIAYQGQPVAVEVRDGDGLLDDGSEVRFFAPAPVHSMHVGDRWNAFDTYWLTVETTPGLRMAVRPAPPGEAPARTTALAQGIWEQNQLYESTIPGVDGDRWFAAALRTEPLQAGSTISAPLSLDLPLAVGASETAVFTVTGAARTVAGYRLHLEIGETAVTTAWQTHIQDQSWQHTVTTTAQSGPLWLTLLAGTGINDLRVDKVYWMQPVTLDFAFKGAAFSGVAGVWRYQLARTPAAGALYDVTDPLQPARLEVEWGITVAFEDGPAARHYWVAGPGALHTPGISAHRPLVLSGLTGADALYIAPAQFHEELAPLVAHRQRQGYQVAVIDVQEVYDAWSYGRVSPTAIRDFLRYAVHTWTPAPISVVLVGDATTDPLDYTGAHNLDILPAYFANIDPWLGEVACESCFAQLDDDDPLAGLTDPGFLIDIWLGRFSIQTGAQLAAVVDKILRYERSAAARWPHSSLYVADDYIHADGELDSAGDFAYMQDVVVVGDAAKGLPPLQSARLSATRVYYDPRPGGVTDPWREPNAIRARERVIEEFQRGPGLVVYNGHANHFQWASTQRSLPQPYLFGTNDIDLLHNIERLGIVLAMTCLTSQFVHVSTTGTTIDEHFQRQPDGGAVAVWGSTGLSVAYGHEALMRGFQVQLWRAPPAHPRLGELVEAGYLALFASAGCCQETRQVFALLGDPLTPVFLWSHTAFAPTIVEGQMHSQVFLPVVQK